MKYSIVKNINLVKPNIRKKLILSVVLGLVFSTSFADYTISKFSINSGGSNNMTGGNYKLKSSIAQVDVGAMNGGDYSLNGGFWQQNNDLIFKNGFE